MTTKNQANQANQANQPKYEIYRYKENYNALLLKNLTYMFEEERFMMKEWIRKPESQKLRETEILNIPYPITKVAFSPPHKLKVDKLKFDFIRNILTQEDLNKAYEESLKDRSLEWYLF